MHRRANALKANFTYAKSRQNKLIGELSKTLNTFCEDVLAMSKIRGTAKVFERKFHATAKKGGASKAWGKVRSIKNTSSRLMIKLKKKMNTRAKVTDQLQLGLAGGSLSMGPAAVAKEFSVHKKAAVERVKMTAGCLSAYQDKVLDAAYNYFTLKEPTLEYAAVETMWDGGSQKCAVTHHVTRESGLVALRDVAPRPAIEDAAAARSVEVALMPRKSKWGKARILRPKLRARLRKRTQQRRRTVELNAVRMFMQWLERGSRTPVVVELYFPPMELPNGSAKALWQNMKGHPAMKKAQQVKKTLLNLATKAGSPAVDLDECDDASVNAAYHAASCAVDNPDWCKDRLKCQNHQNMHCIVSPIGVNSIFTTQAVASLHSAATLLGMGSARPLRR